MPEIGRFGKTRILMFFHDENPPHVHINGTGFAGKLRISDGDVIAGSAPGGVLGQARGWIDEHRGALLALWQEFQN